MGMIVVNGGGLIDIADNSMVIIVHLVEFGDGIVGHLNAGVVGSRLVVGNIVPNMDILIDEKSVIGVVMGQVHAGGGAVSGDDLGFGVCAVNLKSIRTVMMGGVQSQYGAPCGVGIESVSVVVSFIIIDHDAVGAGINVEAIYAMVERGIGVYSRFSTASDESIILDFSGAVEGVVEDLSSFGVDVQFDTVASVA